MMMSNNKFQIIILSAILAVVILMITTISSSSSNLINAQQQPSTTIPDGTTMITCITNSTTSQDFVTVLRNVLFIQSYPLNSTVVSSFAPSPANDGNYSVTFYFQDPQPLVDRFTSTSLQNQVQWNMNRLVQKGIRNIVFNVATPPTPPAAASWTFRLVNVTNNANGWNLARLETKPSSSAPWGSICDDSISRSTVRVLCQQIGYDPSVIDPHFIAISQIPNASFVAPMLSSPTNPIYIDNLFCSTGATSLDNCSFIYSNATWPRSNCNHGEDLTISCVAPPPVNTAEWQFRLIDATSGQSSQTNSSIKSGRLEVQVRAGGEWGAVCDDNFGFEAATAACKSLGFSQIPFGLPIRGTGSKDPILLTGISCSSALNQTLQQCSFVEQDPYNGGNQVCYGWEAVGVDCTGTMPMYKDAFIQYNITINTTLFDVVGSLTQLSNYLLVDSSRIKVLSQSLPATDVARVLFVFTDPALQDIPTFLTRARLDMSMTSVPISSLQSIAGIISVSSQQVDWQWDLIPYNGESSVGTLVVKPPFSASWGTVCGAEGFGPNTFTDNEALAACRQLGYTNLKTASAVSMLRNDAIPSDAPIFVKKMSCVQNASSLNNAGQCQWSFPPDFSSISTCNHLFDVALDCTNTDPAAWKLQLQETSPGSNRGLVQFRPSDNDRWGTICSSGITDIDAKYICQAAGYPNVQQAYALLDYGGGNGTIYLNDVRCDQYSGSFTNCSFEIQTAAEGFTHCSHSQDLAVDCNNLPRPADPIIGFTATMTTSDTRYFASRMATFAGEKAARVIIFSNVSNGTAGYNTLMFRFTDANPSDASELPRTDLDFLVLQLPSNQLQAFMGIIQLSSNVSDVIKTTMQVKLVGPNASQGVGVVMVKPDATTPYGSICDDGLLNDVVAARAMCNSLGYMNVQNPHYVKVSSAAGTVAPKPDGYVFLDQVKCSGTPGEYLQNCSFVYSAPELSKPLTDCNTWEAVALNCVDEIPSPPPAPLAAYQFKLDFVGDSTTEGLLLARSTGPPVGQFGTVCGFKFDQLSANAICASLGYQTPKASYIYGFNSPNASNYNVALSGVDCSTANNAIQNCSFVTTYNNYCTKSELIALDCGMPPPWQVRVQPSTASRPQRGLIQVRPDGNSQWGYACSFSSSDTAAQQICSSAGLQPAPYAVMIQYYGGGTGPSYIDSLKCLPSDQYFPNCSFYADRTGISSFCAPKDALGVDCRTEAPAPFPEIQFSAYTQSSVAQLVSDVAMWLFIDTTRVQVVSNSSNQPAPAGQRANDQQTYNIINFIFTETSSTYLTRTDLEFFLLQTSSHTLKRDLSINYLLSNSSSAVQQTMQLRLNNGTDPSRGLLQVRPTEDEEWGTVCDDSISTKELNAICRSLGFTNPSPSMYTIPGGGGGQGFIYVDQLQCNEDPSTTFQNGCNFIYSPPSYKPVHNCRHNEDVYVDCLTAVPPATTSFAFAPGTITKNGRQGLLLASTNGVTGTICGFTFNDQDALAACRSLGFNTPRASYHYGMAGGDNYPIVAGRVDCSSATGPYLENCSVTDTYAQYCRHADDIGIDCSLPPEWIAKIIPENPSRPYRGRLALRENTTADWGFACSFGVNQFVAPALCRTAGFNVQQAIALEFYGGGVGMPVMDSLRCGVNDTYISNCSYNTKSRFGGKLCNTYDALALDCSGNPRSKAPPLLFVATTQQNATTLFSRIAAWFFVDSNRFVEVSTVSNGTVGWNIINFMVSDLPPTSTWGMSQSDLEYYLLQLSPRSLTMYLGVESLANNATTVVSQTMQVRLFNYTLNTSAGLTSGIIQVRPDSNADWGTVCDDNIGIPEAITLCKLAGITTPSAAPLISMTEGRGFIYIDDLHCPYSAQSLADCKYAYTAPLTFGSSHNCKHYEDTAIDCLFGGAATTTSLPPTTTTTPAPVPPPYQFSFAPGTITKNGMKGLLLATTPQGQTGTVCGFTFNDLDAVAACRSLGFSTTRAAYFYGFAGGDSYNITVGRVDCSSATGPYLQNCSVTDTYAQYCRHADDIGVDCSPPPQWDVTVVAENPARPYRGRLALRQNSTADWGFACSFGINDNVGGAACRSAGFNVPQGIALEFYGGGINSNAVMDSIRCGVNDSYLDNCSYSTQNRFGGKLCNTYDALGVDCSGNSRIKAPPLLFTATAQMNSTEMFNRIALWFFIPSERFSLVSQVNNGTAGWNTIQFTVNDLPTTSGGWGMSQTDIEYYLLQLSPRTLQNYLSIQDLANNGTALVSQTMQVRIFNYTLNTSSDLTNGIIQVRPDSNADWGTVCDDNIGTNEAITLCKLAGITNPSATPLVYMSEGRGFIYIDDLHCPSTAGSLSDCKFAYSPPLGLDDSHNCKHYEDTAIECMYVAPTPAPPPPPSYSFQFAPGTITKNGMKGLLLATTPQGQTGTVCGFTFNDLDALAACKSLGYNTQRAAYIYGMTGGDSYNITVGRVDCSSATGPYLENCSLSDTYAQYCRHTDDIGLDCSPPPNWDVKVIPANAARPYRGQLAVRPNATATWGFACSFGINDNVGGAACRSAGFNIPQGIAIEFYGGGINSLPYMDSIRCGVNDTYLQNCSYSTQNRFGGKLCNTYDAIGLDCSGNDRMNAPPLLFSAITQRNGTEALQGIAYWFFIPVTRFQLISEMNNGTAGWYNVTFMVNDLPPDASFGLSRTDVEYYLLQMSPLTLSRYLNIVSLQNNATNVVSQTMQVRLYNQTTNTSSGLSVGLVQVRPDSNADWGTVCDDNIGINEAVTLCKLAGVANPSSTPRLMVAEGQGFIYIDDLHCPPNAQSLADCKYAYSAPLTFGTSHNCKHYEDLAVDCLYVAPSTTTTTAAPTTTMMTSTTTATPAPPMMPYSFQFAPGTISPDGNKGLLLATTPQGQTGTVCGFTFNNQDALAACRSLGFNTPRAAYLYGYPGGSSYNVTVGRVDCSSATGPYLQNCSLSDTYANFCTHRDDVGLDCSHPPEWIVSVVPTSPARNYRGRVSVKPNATAPEGFVCSYSADDRVALALCNSAGFNVQQAVVIGYYGYANAPASATPYLDNIQCGVNDTQNVGNCSYTSSLHRERSIPLCQTWSAVGVSCGETRKPAPIVVFTAIANNNATITAQKLASWFFVDPSRFNITASVPYNTTMYQITFQCTDLPSTSTWGMSRADLEYYLLQLSPRTLSRYLDIVQLNNNIADSVSQTMEARLYNYTTGQQSNSGLTSGIIQVRPDPSYDWGTVCDDHIGPDELYTLCVLAGVASPVNPTLYSTEGEGFIYVDDLKCASGATQLSDCKFTYSAPNVLGVQHNCRHYEDVAINCMNPTTQAPAPTSPSYTFSIAPGTGPSPRQGLLLATNSQGETGTVCGYTFTDTAAAAICNSMGFTTSRASYVYGMPDAAANYSIVIGSVSCKSDQSAADNCTFSTKYADICTARDSIGISCQIPPQWDTTIIPVSTVRPTRGRLAIRPNSTVDYGFACSIGVDDLAALAICRQVDNGKYASLQQAAAITFYGGGTGPVYMDNIRCGPTDRYLDNCSYTSAQAWVPSGSASTSQYPRCYSYDALGIDCSGASRVDTAPIKFTATTQDNSTVLAERIAGWFFITSDRIVIQPPAGQTNGTAGWNLISFTFGELPPSSSWGMSRQDLEYYITQTQPRTRLNYMGITALTSNATSSITSTLSVRIYNQSTGQTSPALTRGLIQVRPNDNADWGTVCDDNMGVNEMIALCGAAGVTDPTPQLYAAEGQGFIYVDDLQCPAGSTDLSNCNFAYTPPLASYTFGNCKHYEDTAIDCLAPTTTAAPNTPTTSTTTTTIIPTIPSTTSAPIPGADSFAFRLVPPTGASTNRIGLLEAQRVINGKPSGIWGSVCGFSFDSMIAQRFCNQLGFPDAQAHYLHGYSDPTITIPDNIAISYVNCRNAPSSSQNVSGCTFSDQYGSICRAIDNVGLDCTPQPPWDIHVLPANPAKKYRGLLQVRPTLQDKMGFVCSSNVNDYAAVAACRSAGFTNINDAVAIPNYGGGTGPAWIRDLSCNPLTDQYLQNCSYKKVVDFNYCNSFNALGVDCSGGARLPDVVIAFTATTWSPVPILQRALSAWLFTDPSRILFISQPVSNGTDGFYLVSFVFTEIPATSFGLSRADLESFMLQTSTYTLRSQLNISSLTNNASSAIAPSMTTRIVVDPRNPSSSTTPSSGLVQVRPTIDSNWGTVCNDGITMKEASMLCRSVGFDRAFDFSSASINMNTFGVIYVDQLQCPDGASKFADCTFVYSPPSSNARHNCLHYEDLIINCTNSPSSSSTTTSTPGPSGVTPSASSSTTATSITLPSLTGTTVSGVTKPTILTSSSTTTTATTTGTASPTTTTTTATTSTPTPTTTPAPQPMTGNIANESTFDIDKFRRGLEAKFPDCTFSNIVQQSGDTNQVTFDVQPPSCAKRVEQMDKQDEADIGITSFAAVATPSPNAPPPTNSDDGKSMIPIIAGAAAGGVLLIAGIAFFIYYRKKQASPGTRNNQRFVDQDYVAMMDYSPPEV